LLAEPHISVVDGPAFSVSVGAAAAGERGHCPWFRKPACRANHRSRGSGREPGAGVRLREPPRRAANYRAGRL
jgi:hypothetical protein